MFLSDESSSTGSDFYASKLEGKMPNVNNENADRMEFVIRQRLTSVFDSDESIVGTDYWMKCLKHNEVIYLQSNERAKTYLKKDGTIGVPPSLMSPTVAISIEDPDPDFWWTVEAVDPTQTDSEGCILSTFGIYLKNNDNAYLQVGPAVGDAITSGVKEDKAKWIVTEIPS